MPSNQRYQPTSGVKYIKINRFDEQGNDNTLSLQELTNLRIKFDDLGIVNFPITSITEYPTYYLYSTTTTLLPGNVTASVDNNILNYYVSASKTGSSSAIGTTNIITDYNVELSNILNYFNTSSGFYILNNSPNTHIQLSSSAILSTSSMFLQIFGNGELLSSVEGTFPPTQVSTSLSIPNLLNSSYYFLNIRDNNIGLHNYSNVQFTITQSSTPHDESNLTILEPYLTTDFFYNDCNALFGNEDGLDTNSNFMKINYDDGSVIPSNQQQIINRTAEIAPVKPYNYALKAQILPRYEGTRVNQQNANKWTEGDISPDKTPSVRLLKNSLAYVDYWGGWPPEKMDASGAHIKYLIDENGDIITPNVTNYALYSNQNTFISNENVTVNSPTEPNPTSPNIKIIRGATRIEPILYNQVKHYQDPPMTFESEIRFTDNNPGSTETINDYTATLSPSSTFPLTSIVPSGIYMDIVQASGSDITTDELNPGVPNWYTASLAVINENVDLVFEVNLFLSNYSSPNTHNTPVFASIADDVSLIGDTYSIILNGGARHHPLHFITTVPKTQLSTNQHFHVALWTQYPYQIKYESTSTFKISTNPLPTPNIETTDFFITASFPPMASSSYLFITSSLVINYYGNSKVYQKNIENSQFNNITLPFIFKYGDEMRFEGNENKVFMIKNIDTNASYRIDITTTVPAIAIELSSQISGTLTDTNQFLVRRYVDDPSLILVENYKPAGSNGPYIFSPEFKTEKLTNNIDQYIQDLTEKGLI
jgi:hypothetical protein